MGALGGFLGGLLGAGAKKQSGAGQQQPAPGLGTQPLGTGMQQPSPTPAPAPAAAPAFQGIIPMAMNYYQNHQAQVRDASAQPHISSLADPNLTPEQRSYHQSNLQQIYANQPQQLQKLGILPKGTWDPTDQNNFTPTQAVAPATATGASQ